MDLVNCVPMLKDIYSSAYEKIPLDVYFIFLLSIHLGLAQTSFIYILTVISLVQIQNIEVSVVIKAYFL